MGLRHSGETADAALANTMEFGTIDAPGLLKAYGIDNYCRFKDDIFFLASSRLRVRRFVARLKKNSAFYMLHVEAISSTCVQMLDSETFTTSTGFRLQVKPKDTNLGVPLSHESAHPSLVHFNWPKAYIQRTFNLSTDPQDAATVAFAFIDNLKAHYQHQPIIDEARQYVEQCLSRAIKRPSKDSSHRLWVSMPYHPLLIRSFKQVVHSTDNVFNHQLWEAAFKGTKIPHPHPSIGIAWSASDLQTEQWIRCQKFSWRCHM